MSAPVSNRTRSLLSRSLPIVLQRKELLLEGTERSLGWSETREESFGQAETTAMILVELLLEQVRSLVQSGALAPLQDAADQHRKLGITGRHYSRFGDALVPVLRDLLGPTVPREVAAAWCDTFWTIIRAAQPAEPDLPKSRPQLASEGTSASHSGTL
jgi:hemoglobin-like flavoprotein